MRRRDPNDVPLDATTKKGLIAAGVLMIIAAIVVAIILGKKHAREQAEHDYEAKLDGIVKTIEETDQKNREALQKICEWAESIKKEWADTRIESIVATDLSRFRGRITELEAREKTLGLVHEIETIMNEAEARTSDDLRNARQKITDAEPGIESLGDPALPAKVKEWKLKIDKLLVHKVSDEARAYAATHVDRTALTKFGQAEDDVRTAIENAKKANNKADDAEFTKIYKEELLPASDELSQKVCDAAFIESVPWKDLLSSEFEKRWSKSTSVPGFSFRLENGVMTVSPPDAGTKLEAFVGIFDQKDDRLRHFALDVEYQIDGDCALFLHAAVAPSIPNGTQSEQYDIKTTNKGGVFVPNQKYHMAVKYVGSDLLIWYPDDMELGRYEVHSSWAKRRYGGIVFKIPEGCRLKITKLRLKDLR